jgi:hypothetical protein
MSHRYGIPISKYYSEKMAKICHKKITREKGGEEEVRFGLLI